MRLPFATLAATLSVVALIAWLSLGRPTAPMPEEPVPEQMEGDPLRESTGGSAAPCAVPLAWQIARVDDGFAMEVSQAERALEEAMALWEDAVGRPLFTTDPEEGFPVRFVFDERQEGTTERRRLEAEMAQERRDLERRREELERAAREEAQAAAAHDRRARELERRVAEHNERVRRWNERGGAPPDTMAATEAAGAALERERRDLQELETQIATDRARLREESASLEELADAHNARIDELGRRFPAAAVESGVYREAVLVEGGSPSAVEREIRVYRFDDFQDLVRVLAHELGHALGLGHAQGRGALMSESYGRTTSPRGGRLVQPEDVQSWRERCPGEVEG